MRNKKGAMLLSDIVAMIFLFVTAIIAMALTNYFVLLGDLSGGHQMNVKLDIVGDDVSTGSMANALLEATDNGVSVKEMMVAAVVQNTTEPTVQGKVFKLNDVIGDRISSWTSEQWQINIHSDQGLLILGGIKSEATSKTHVSSFAMSLPALDDFANAEFYIGGVV
jgi:hypothetical protein